MTAVIGSFLWHQAGVSELMAGKKTRLQSVSLDVGMTPLAKTITRSAL